MAKLWLVDLASSLLPLLLLCSCDSANGGFRASGIWSISCAPSGFLFLCVCWETDEDDDIWRCGGFPSTSVSFVLFRFLFNLLSVMSLFVLLLVVCVSVFFSYCPLCFSSVSVRALPSPVFWVFFSGFCSSSSCSRSLHLPVFPVFFSFFSLVLWFLFTFQSPRFCPYLLLRCFVFSLTSSVSLRWNRGTKVCLFSPLPRFCDHQWLFGYAPFFWVFPLGSACVILHCFFFGFSSVPFPQFFFVSARSLGFFSVAPSVRSSPLFLWEETRGTKVCSFFFSFSPPVTFRSLAFIAREQSVSSNHWLQV